MGKTRKKLKGRVDKVKEADNLSESSQSLKVAGFGALDEIQGKNL
jgi:hypothetical protein